MEGGLFGTSWVGTAGRVGLTWDVKEVSCRFLDDGAKDDQQGLL